MSKNSFRVFMACLCIFFICLVCVSSPFQTLYKLPQDIHILQGEETSFTVFFPLSVVVAPQENREQSIIVKDNMNTTSDSWSHPVRLKTVSLGTTTIQFNLFGLIPVRTVHVDVLPTLKLVPGGHSIGVVLHSQGVIVVGYSPILGEEEKALNPAREAGLLVGDVVLAVNGTPIESDTQLSEMIDRAGKEKILLDLLVKRGETKLSLAMRPLFCSETQRYRLGLFVRDSAAGVGTLTYYDPESKIYGALGHVITDSDTNQAIDCEQGKIVSAVVSGIQQGKRGQPGEKIGVFLEENKLLGDIQKNTNFGISGELAEPLDNDLYTEALPVASMNQVQTGPAEILTVVDGQTIERFSIEIQKVNLQEVPEGKGLVIQITDPRLLAKTGGIVQGMSGSPIIQQGKLVGAVTHVFVHDPTKGYGCFIDWMLMESGILPKQKERAVSQLFTRVSHCSLFYRPILVYNESKRSNNVPNISFSSKCVFFFQFRKGIAFACRIDLID
ncbi:MAG: SpoIVB peptidase [Sporomusaceae bacterium]|nr:SpoIVB peptidase [Sporomusaceae bacterium]